MKSKDWLSHTTRTHSNPMKRPVPTFRSTRHVSLKPLTRSSGFNMNCLTRDGYGWKPHRVLNGKLFRFIE